MNNSTLQLKQFKSVKICHSETDCSYKNQNTFSKINLGVVRKTPTQKISLKIVQGEILFRHFVWSGRYWKMKNRSDHNKQIFNIATINSIKCFASFMRCSDVSEWLFRCDQSVYKDRRSVTKDRRSGGLSGISGPTIVTDCFRRISNFFASLTGVFKTVFLLNFGWWPICDFVSKYLKQHVFEQNSLCWYRFLAGKLQGNKLQFETEECIFDLTSWYKK